MSNNIDSTRQVLNLLGLARRARQVTAGEGLVLKAIRANQAKVVFVASDAGNSTIKQFTNKCAYYHVPLIKLYTKNQLSQAIGQSRTVIAIEQAGFAKRMLQLLDDSSDNLK